MKIIATIASALMLFGASACASGGTPFSHMSDVDFLRAAPDVQSSYISGLNTDTLALAAKRQAELKAGLAVKYGDDETGHVLQCSEIPGEYNAVGVYPVHNPSGMSTASHAGMLYLVADKKCNVLYQKGPDGTPVPIKLIANVATTEDLLGAVMRGSIPAVLNGIGAAAITSAGQCDEACGMSLVVNGGTALAAANSRADSGANVNVGVSGQCGSSACRTTDD